MKIDINNLPSGDAILHQIITDLVSEVLSLTNKNISLEDQLTSVHDIKVNISYSPSNLASAA